MVWTSSMVWTRSIAIPKPFLLLHDIKTLSVPNNKMLHLCYRRNAPTGGARGELKLTEQEYASLTCVSLLNAATRHERSQGGGAVGTTSSHKVP